MKQFRIKHRNLRLVLNELLRLIEVINSLTQLTLIDSITLSKGLFTSRESEKRRRFE